jgi:hypothetical protein
MSMLWNTTLEAVKTALDIQVTARNDAQVRRAIQSGTRAAEGLLLRRFRPWTGTRRFRVLTTRASSVLVFGRYELVTATTVTALDNTVIDPADYTLVAARNLVEGEDGPPYAGITLNDGSAWPGGGATIAGVYGYRNDEEIVGTLGATLGSAATHATGTDVYTLTGVELDRGQAGTAAASHATSATIYRHVVPGLVQDLTGAEAINQLQQETGGYGATRGSGESETAAGLGGLAAIRASAKQAYRRPRSWLGV